MSTEQLDVTEEQVLYFRALRGGLAGRGAATPEAAASSLLGGQAQLEAPALKALSQRTASRPTAEALKTALWQERTLIRTWGQRDTVHLYDAQDWPLIVAARSEWVYSGRRGGMADEDDLQRAREYIASLNAPFTRKDLYDVVSQTLHDKVAPVAEKANQTPTHFAAGRLIWQLSAKGDVCTVFKQGSEQAYAYREHWLPSLAWPSQTDPVEAAASLAKRYLSTYGPATIKDIAHFFGTRIKEVKTWMAHLHEQDALLSVSCGERSDLWLFREDVETLCETPPKSAKKWPVRLLPSYDSMLMGHADKDWAVPQQEERKQIWGKAARVSAVVLARGRIVATWKHKSTKKTCTLQLTPLSGWNTRAHKAAVLREAKDIAVHLGTPDAKIVLKMT